MHFDDDFALQQLQVYLLAHSSPALVVLPDGGGQALGPVEQGEENPGLDRAAWHVGLALPVCGQGVASLPKLTVPLLKAHTFWWEINNNRESWDPFSVLCIANNNVLSERKKNQTHVR